jgi:hypothetical protein
VRHNPLIIAAAFFALAVSIVVPAPVRAQMGGGPDQSRILKLDLVGDMIVVYEGRRPILQIRAQSLPNFDQVGIVLIDGARLSNPAAPHRSPLMDLAEKAVRGGDPKSFEALIEAGKRMPGITRPGASRVPRPVPHAVPPRAQPPMAPRGPMTPAFAPVRTFMDLVGALALTDLARKGDPQAQINIRNGTLYLNVEEFRRHLPRDYTGVVHARASAVPDVRFSGRDDDLAGLLNLAHEAWRRDNPEARASFKASADKAGIAWLEVAFREIPGLHIEPSDVFKRPPRSTTGPALFREGIFLLVDALGLLAWEDGLERPLVIVLPAR